MIRFPAALRQTVGTVASAAAAAVIVTFGTFVAASTLASGTAGAAAPARDAATFEITSTKYTSLCDASAAIALSSTQFAVVNDEDNLLRFFTFGNPAPSPEPLDLNALLGIADAKEADIEGAAQMGEVVYWITSHGRNKDGKHQPRRLRLFATRLTPAGAAKPLAAEGTAYRDLLKKFIEPILQKEGFTADPDGPDKPAKAPEKPDSLNIEGLATSGTSLLIGFRNPLPKVKDSTRALVVELKNPAALITASPAAPERGEIFRLDLGGRGIRSLEALPNGRGFLIVAGPFNDGSNFALYRWDGTQANQPVLVPGIDFKDFTPEALFVDKTSSTGSNGGALNLTLVSDDGGLPLEDGVACKDAPKTKWRTRLAKLRIE